MNISCQQGHIVHPDRPAQGIRDLKNAGFENVMAGVGVWFPDFTGFRRMWNRRMRKNTDRLPSGIRRFFGRTGRMGFGYPLCADRVLPFWILIKIRQSGENIPKRTEAFLDFLAPMAKEMGITICIENLYDSLGPHLVEGPCCNAKKAVERIERMNEKYHSEVLGFCFDTGHANLVGLNFEQFLTTLGGSLKVLHIHDNDGNSDLHQIPFTFTMTRENQSSTDWEGFMRGLRNIGYSGVLSFETAPVLSAFPQVMKQDVLAFIARIGEYFSLAFLGQQSC